jgi:hypothetical protein
MPAPFRGTDRPADETAQELFDFGDRAETAHNRGDRTTDDPDDQYLRGGAHRGTPRMLLFGRRLLAWLVRDDARLPSDEGL